MFDKEYHRISLKFLLTMELPLSTQGQISDNHMGDRGLALDWKPLKSSLIQELAGLISSIRSKVIVERIFPRNRASSHIQCNSPPVCHWTTVSFFFFFLFHNFFFLSSSFGQWPCRGGWPIELPNGKFFHFHISPPYKMSSKLGVKHEVERFFQWLLLVGQSGCLKDNRGYF